MRAETIHEHFLLFRQGAEKGLEGLYRQYHRPLLKHGLFIVNDEFAVSTIVQDAFLKAWKFRARLTHAPHAYRFMRLNVSWDCYDHLRQVINQRQHLVYTDTPEYYERAGNWEAEEEDNTHAVTEARQQAVNKVIRLLPGDQGRMLQLHYKEGLNYQQIAKRFGSGSGRVRHEVERGVGYLRRVVGA